MDKSAYLKFNAISIEFTWKKNPQNPENRLFLNWHKKHIEATYISRGQKSINHKNRIISVIRKMWTYYPWLYNLQLCLRKEIFSGIKQTVLCVLLWWKILYFAWKTKDIAYSSGKTFWILQCFDFRNVLKALNVCTRKFAAFRLW